MENLKEQALGLYLNKKKENRNMVLHTMSRYQQWLFLKIKDRLSKKILKYAAKGEDSYMMFFEMPFYKLLGYNYVIAAHLKYYFESQNFYVNEIKENDIHLYISWT